MLVDHNLGGIVKDATVLDGPAAVIAELRREFPDEPMMTISQVSPADARRLVEPALAMTDMTVDPPGAEDFAAHRAFAHARMRVLPPSPAAEPVEVGDAERAALVIVVNQLWDDDPPEAWAAARRLLDDGYEGHEILHHLALLVAPELHAALTERPVDVEGYRRALSDLAEHGIR
ncbi:hypothetical protein [Pseudonocardia sp. H11422]|uniref:hypothetical protein n=1 Tax=Pseudonocardia sp. H11422 TaxID=2835866 RepID=UPI001BDDBC4D|nr:hypothetical protein [Pseudonocardia sp. H11422]